LIEVLFLHLNGIWAMYN